MFRNATRSLEFSADHYSAVRSLRGVLLARWREWYAVLEANGMVRPAPPTSPQRAK